ncbi:MAG: RNA-binding S4 domain-containing protein [Candidatus Zixiibacteriota bacterium]|nr:MAG: RNA-binding S4 domain-containing protein [candidate division Zixibacteria bacterium]
MRLDDYLSTVGIVKRRTLAKQLAQNGMVGVNGRTVKASYQVKVRDIIHIRGTRSITTEVLDIPSGSVPKSERDKYFRQIEHI